MSKTSDRADRLERLLTEHGIENKPVTIDGDDALFIIACLVTLNSTVRVLTEANMEDMVARAASSYGHEHITSLDGRLMTALERIMPKLEADAAMTKPKKQVH